MRLGWRGGMGVSSFVSSCHDLMERRRNLIADELTCCSYSSGGGFGRYRGLWRYLRGRGLSQIMDLPETRVRRVSNPHTYPQI